MGAVSNFKFCCKYKRLEEYCNLQAVGHKTYDAEQTCIVLCIKSSAVKNNALTQLIQLQV